MTTTATATKELWPQPIPILGLTGEYATGKSWFGISISPDPKRVRVYDLEMSSDPYKSLGFDHVNVPRLLLEKYPKGYKPVDLWNWWLNDVSELAPGQFDVIMVDPVTDLERGLTDWVQANPAVFGHTANQYQMMSGIMWGDVKDYWKSILSGRVATKCQTFVFVAHMGTEFDSATKKATKNRKPKGKETLQELATLYLQMERTKDKTGGRRGVPTAIVLKSRVSIIQMTDVGPQIREVLPPRIPVATPKAIREYMLNPPDFNNLKDEEKAPEKTYTDDERLEMELAKAEAERDAETMKAERQGKSGSATAATSANGDGVLDAAKAKEGELAARIDAADSEATLNAIIPDVKAAHEAKQIDDAAKSRLAEKFKGRMATVKRKSPATTTTATAGATSAGTGGAPTVESKS